MSVQALAWVLKNSPYKGNFRLIHIVVANKANEDHDNKFWMSTNNVAREANCSRRTVQYAFDLFERDGYLVKLEEADSDFPQVFKFITPGVQNLHGVQDSHLGVQNTTVRGAEVAPNTNRNKYKPRQLKINSQEPLTLAATRLRAQHMNKGCAECGSSSCVCDLIENA